MLMTMKTAEVQRDDRPTEDHVVQLSGATWADYERLLELRGDSSAPRITFLEGTLEIMSPSFAHERIKSFLALLVATYCLDRDIRVTPAGSWTIKDRAADRGAEPDECYVFGDAPTDRPHLAIEVVWTSGGINKLEVYRKLGVQEVWFWRRGKLVPYVLRGDAYVEVATSEVLPGLDLDLLASFVDRPSLNDAVRDFRAALGR
jgi:Uma2 family endonuclease